MKRWFENDFFLNTGLDEGGIRKEGVQFAKTRDTTLLVVHNGGQLFFPLRFNVVLNVGLCLVEAFCRKTQFRKEGD